MVVVYVVVADDSLRQRLASLLTDGTAGGVICATNIADVPSSGTSIVVVDIAHLEAIRSRIEPDRMVLVAPHSEQALALAWSAGIETFVDEAGHGGAIRLAVLAAQLRVANTMGAPSRV